MRVHGIAAAVHTIKCERGGHGMETATARILFILVCLGIGFRNLSGTRLADRTPADLTAVLIASGTGTMAVIRPETPFQVFLAPLAALILVYQVSRLVSGFPASDKGIPAAAPEADEALHVTPVSRRSGPPPMALPLIENGKIRTDNLNKLNRTQLWLRRELRHFGYRDMRQINYLTIDRSGNFFMDLKENRHRNSADPFPDHR